jgi:hypothetical protein
LCCKDKGEERFWQRGGAAGRQAGATACRLNTLRTDREKGIGQTDTYIHTLTHSGEERKRKCGVAFGSWGDP